MKLMNQTYSLLLSKEKRDQFLDFYKDFSLPVPNPYMDLFAKNDVVAVSLYKMKSDGTSKATFQGPGAYSEAKIWDPSLQKLTMPVPKKPTINIQIRNFYPQIGSDEVGTGDFFGPIEVVASYVAKEKLSRIEELGVTDSKKMKDERILEIGPVLIKEFPYAHLSLDNSKYNEVIQGNNMNKIKAKMHNACLLKLHKKYSNSFVYQDEFANEDLYYSYLKGEKEVLRGISFHTKGESLFPSVALSSVIARYSFLKKMEKMSEKYKVNFPFGAGKEVDLFAKKFVQTHDLNELRNVAKTNFNNYKKLIDTDEVS